MTTNSFEAAIVSATLKVTETNKKITSQGKLLMPDVTKAPAKYVDWYERNKGLIGEIDTVLKEWQSATEGQPEVITAYEQSIQYYQLYPNATKDPAVMAYAQAKSLIAKMSALRAKIPPLPNPSTYSVQIKGTKSILGKTEFFDDTSISDASLLSIENVGEIAYNSSFSYHLIRDGERIGIFRIPTKKTDCVAVSWLSKDTIINDAFKKTVGGLSYSDVEINTSALVRNPREIISGETIKHFNDSFGAGLATGSITTVSQILSASIIKYNNFRGGAASRVTKAVASFLGKLPVVPTSWKGFLAGPILIALGTTVALAVTTDRTLTREDLESNEVGFFAGKNTGSRILETSGAESTDQDSIDISY